MNKFYWVFGFCLLTHISIGLSAGNDPKMYVPKNALALLPVVKAEQSLVFPELPIPHYIGSLIEQESCISLTHSRCWSAVSELNTSREIGIGFFQITKAFNKTGGVRFDTLKDLKRKYPVALKDLSWETIRTKPDLQIRAGILLSRDNYTALALYVEDPIQRLYMADSAYNGGGGNVRKAQRACGLAKGCDPNLWFDNVENYLPQSRAAIYGHRSAFDINREHVTNAFKLRLNKYRPYFTETTVTK